MASSRARLGLVYPLFVLSGACALVYEVAWVRLLTTLFGSTVYAVTTVLAAFMGGLALGSAAYGRWIDGKRRVLAWYGLIELAVAASALGVTLLLAPLEPLTSVLYRALYGAPVLLHAASFVLALLLLLVPTVLMGATFPVMGRYVVRRLQGMERRIGQLYALNTLGAAAGTLLAGFVLIPRLGLTGAVLCGALGDALVGVSILLFGGREEIPAVDAADSQEADRFGRRERRVLWAFGLSGMAALGFEVIWTRVLSMILGCSTYAFTIMLGTFLTGIALGGLAGGRIRGTDRRRLAWLAGLQALAAALGVGSCLLIPRLPLAYLALFPRFGYGGSFWGVIGLQAVLAAVVLLAPTLVFGAVFPLATSLVTGRIGRRGRRIGGAYAANTLGSILGSLLVGFLALPLLGARVAILLLAGVHLVAVAVLRPRPVGRGGRGALAGLVGLGLAGAVASALLPLDPALLAAGVFDARRYVERSGAFTLDRALGGMRLLQYEEGASVTTAVFADPSGERTLYVNGKPVAGGSGGDVKHLKMLGHLPMLLHPNPRSALVIGFGMGVTTGACSLHGARVTCVELSSEVLTAAPLFARDNHEALENPHVEIILGDGKRHASAVRERFDVITADPIHPWVAGSGALYGLEHYRACRERLAGGGIFCQWLPLYQLSGQDVRMIVASFLAAFPRGSVWATEFDGILVGGREPIEIDASRIRRVLGNPRIRRDLAEIGLDEVEGILGLLTADAGGLRELAAGSPLNTDDRPLLEFTAPRSMYRYTPVENLALLGSVRREPRDRLPAPGLRLTAPDLDAQRIFRAADERLAGNLALGSLALEAAEARYRAALEIRPGYHEARKKLATTLVERALRGLGPDADSPGERALHPALELCEEAVRLDPRSPEAWGLLGRLRRAVGREELAREAFGRLLALQPQNRSARAALQGR